MRFVINIIKMSIQRVRYTTMTSTFFVIGVCVSMIMISVGISFSYEHLYAGDSKQDNTPPNGEVYVISGESDKKLTFKDFEKMFDGVRKETGAIFNGLMAHPDYAKINSYYPVSAEWFMEDNEWHYPLISGRYYTAADIKKGEKVALIGTTLESCVRKENGKKYIDINRERYEVLGIIGLKGKRSLWDNRICIPVTALPESVEEDLTLSEGTISLILYSKKGNLVKDQKTIENNGLKIDSNFEIEHQGKVQTENMMNELLQSQDPIYSLAILGYLVTLIYLINIVVFWVEKRRYEIGVRKAVGYTDRDIAKLIFGEILGLTGISACVAIFIQAIMGRLVSRISNYTLQLFWPNILIAMVIVLITALLTSVWPIKKAMKIPPIEALKEGENL